jgi:hypothetical protein
LGSRALGVQFGGTLHLVPNPKMVSEPLEFGHSSIQATTTPSAAGLLVDVADAALVRRET